MLLYGGVFFPARLVPTTVSVFRLDRSESDNEPLRESKRYQVNGLGPTNSRDEVLGPPRLALGFLDGFLALFCSERRFLLNEGSFSLPVSVQPSVHLS